MTEIKIYDTEAKRIEKLCDELRITPADLLESVIDVIEDAVTVTDYGEWFGTENIDYV